MDWLTERYRATVEAWGDVPAADSRRANRFWRKYRRYADALVESGEGRRRLRALIDDADPHVRLVAAIDCLEWFPADAEQELARLQQRDDWIALQAELALRVQQSGGTL